MAGPSTGRGFKHSEPAAPAPAPAPSADANPSLSPFQQYAPSADQLDGAEGRTDSRQVIAIVGALGFMMAAALVIVGVAATIGIVTMRNMASDAAALAGMEDEEVGIIRDTGVVSDEIIERKPVAKAKAKDDEEAPDPRDAAPTTAPGTIILAVDGKLFHSMEVNCPQSNIRTRASFRNGRATAYRLPTTEACVVTFQGSEPVRTKLRGGETRTCYSINPTDCR